MFNSCSLHLSSSVSKQTQRYYVQLLRLLMLLSRIESFVLSTIVHTCLLLIILCHICIEYILASTVKRKYKHVCLFPLWNLSLLSTELVLLNAIFSIVNRSLLIRSGNVESNPGPPPRLLSFATWNIDSLTPKKHFIDSLQSTYDFDLFGICETYLNDKTPDADVLVDVFPDPPFRSDCKILGRARGGVCLFFKDTVPIKRRQDLEFMDETIVAEINLNRKKIIYLLSYRSPNQSPLELDAYMKKLASFLLKASAENPSTIILTGDFNARSPLLWDQESHHNNAGKSLADFCTINGLVQVIDEATHLPRPGIETCIDLVLTNQPYLIVDKGVIPSPSDVCKHQVVHGKLNFNVPCPPPYRRKIWNFKRANIASIQRDIRSTNWDFFFSDKSAEEMVQCFNRRFLNIIERHVPNKVITVDDSDAPFVSPTLKNLIRKSHKIYRDWVKNGKDQTTKNRVDLFRKKTKEAIENAKSSYIEGLSKKICDPTSGHKVFWSAYKRLSNKKKITNIPPLLENGKYVSNFKEKAIVLNNYFAVQCRPFEIETEIPMLTSLTNNVLNSVFISEEAISDIINKLDKNKAHGNDDISIPMLKACPQEVARPLYLIFKKCIDSGTFPQAWKFANVQPVHKKNSRQDKTNYRPISLLPVCAKIFEKIIFDNMYSFLTENNLISENQSGFRPGDSTINQLLAITTEIYNSFEKRDETRAVFLDMSKAFDKVWHEGLVLKMKQNGINGNLLKMLENYLSSRKQRVVLNGVDSPWEDILSGVPQGSVLGPLMFLIYINDLTDTISANIKLFADDSSLFIKVADIDLAQETLASDLDKITQWANIWKMKFNPDISKQAIEVIFTRRYARGKGDHPLLTFNNIPVARETSTKHLGMILDERLAFNKHIVEKIEKAKKGISLMKFLSGFVNRKTLELTFKMHVRPHLEYGDIIYHKCANYLMDKLESIQYQAGIIATGCWQHTSQIKLYKELGWESLAERRRFHRLTYYYKIKNNLTPPYLRSYILSAAPSHASTDRYCNTFFPYCYPEWESLDPEIRNSPNINIFKSRFIKVIRPLAMNTFNVSDRYGLKLLTWLRVEHNDLRAFRYRKNLNCLSPICACGNEEETTEHFLLRCPTFNTPRATLLSTMDNLNPDVIYSNIPEADLSSILLYGDPLLKDHLNNTIILATIRYIKQSKRFKTLEAFISSDDVAP